ncbi:hypothetical protein BDV12DRAFT_177792 [Aspergillus spectabilis]
MITGCIEIGAYNQDESDRWLLVFDVAGVAQIAVNALFRREKGTDWGSVLPITEGVHSQTIWDILQMEYGCPLEGLPGTQWLSNMKAAIIRTGESHPLFAL